MTPDLLNIYVVQVKKMTQRQIADALKKRGINCTQNQVSRTMSGERRNEHLRKPIEEVIGMPGAFDSEFDAVARLRQTA